MQFNLIIIGDEILHGSRIDQHFAFFKSLLEEHGLQLGSVQYLPDDRALLTKQLRRSFEDGLPTFVTGGIGATPDDHTRQAAALALDLPIVNHPQAAQYIEALTLKRGEALDSPEHRQRLKMADFPQGADIVENEYNTIAGFSIRQHYFLPGFPVMAQPMARWVLNRYYTDHFHQRQSDQRSIRVYDLAEAKIAPLMETIEQQYPGVFTYSLPSERRLNEQGEVIPAVIEFGLKAEGEACQQLDTAWQQALDALAALGARLEEQTGSYA